MQCTLMARAAWCAGAVLTLVLITPAAPAAAETGRERASFLIPSAGWHGRPIQEPLPAPATPVRAARAPRGWEAGPASPGTGTHRAGGSQRVRELQWRLRALGYRPGPIDGIYGPRTRAAVGWFQVKHGLAVTGRAGFAVVRRLRDRTTPGRTEPTRARAQEQPVREVTRPAPVVASAEPAGTPLWTALGLMLVAFLAGFALMTWRQRPRSAPAATRGIGYLRVPTGDRRIDAHAHAIEARCADHGIALAGLVTDDAADERRPGLAYAFQQLETGAADCLVVGRVGQLTRSPEELATLLDTMRDAPLVVLNAEPAGRGRWSRATLERGVRDG